MLLPYRFLLVSLGLGIIGRTYAAQPVPGAPAEAPQASPQDVPVQRAQNTPDTYDSVIAKVDAFKHEVAELIRSPFVTFTGADGTEKTLTIAQVMIALKQDHYGTTDISSITTYMNGRLEGHMILTDRATRIMLCTGIILKVWARLSNSLSNLEVTINNFLFRDNLSKLQDFGPGIYAARNAALSVLAILKVAAIKSLAADHPQGDGSQLNLEIFRPQFEGCESLFSTTGSNDIIETINLKQAFYSDACSKDLKVSIFNQGAGGAREQERSIDAGGLRRSFVSMFFQSFFSPKRPEHNDDHEFFVIDDSRPHHMPIINCARGSDRYWAAFLCFGKALFLSVVQNLPARLLVPEVFYQAVIHPASFPAQSATGWSQWLALLHNYDVQSFNNIVLGVTCYTNDAAIIQEHNNKVGGILKVSNLPDEDFSLNNLKEYLRIHLAWEEEELARLTDANWQETFIKTMIKPALCLVDASDEAPYAIKAIRNGWNGYQLNNPVPNNARVRTYYNAVASHNTAAKRDESINRMCGWRPNELEERINDPEMYQSFLIAFIQELSPYEFKHYLFKSVINGDELINNIKSESIEALAEELRPAAHAYIDAIKDYITENKHNQSALSNIVDSITGSTAYNGAEIRFNFVADGSLTESFHTCFNSVDVYLKTERGGTVMRDLVAIYNERGADAFKQFVQNDIISTWFANEEFGNEMGGNGSSEYLGEDGYGAGEGFGDDGERMGPPDSSSAAAAVFEGFEDLPWS